MKLSDLKLQFVFAGLMLLVFCVPKFAFASILSLGPSSGTFETEGTFDVSVYLNTEGKAINAFDINLKFPADKMQLVDPSTGKSIATLWTAPPSFNNGKGTIRLQGGIPNGINTSSGLIATLKFRVKAIGGASIYFTDQTKVLLNDGSGSDSLHQVNNGVYSLTLPPPAGPIVSSETNPDQSKWSNRKNVSLRWDPGEEEVEGYSYILSSSPLDTPDDTSEGEKKDVVYKNLSDGKHYFHIKAKRDGIWGGVSHFALNVDTTPPAEFPLSILPSSSTSNRNPVLEFSTTDGSSGIDRFEMKIVPLAEKNQAVYQQGDQPFFIEISSPYIFPKLEIGSYDIIVRAHDNAGNTRHVSSRLEIHKEYFRINREGDIEIGEKITISRYLAMFIGFLIILALLYLEYKLRKENKSLKEQLKGNALPKKVKKQLKELKKYHKKYGSLSKVIFLLLFSGALLVATSCQAFEVNPPIIDTISNNIFNDEIAYVGGEVSDSSANIDIFFQNTSSGETFKKTAHADEKGHWFYRHDGFLSGGEYLVWTQSSLGNEKSPPSPQQRIFVEKTALQIGSSRISRELLFGICILFMMIVVIFLFGYILRHYFQIKINKKRFEKEVREAEQAIDRGFAVLRADIQKELNFVKKIKMSKSLSAQEQKIERKLLNDLERIEQKIGKEVMDIERLENFK